jgi:hypothetical protein
MTDFGAPDMMYAPPVIEPGCMVQWRDPARCGGPWPCVEVRADRVIVLANDIRPRAGEAGTG